MYFFRTRGSTYAPARRSRIRTGNTAHALWENNAPSAARKANKEIKIQTLNSGDLIIRDMIYVFICINTHTNINYTHAQTVCETV